MQSQIKSIRPFIGAKDFAESRSFYQDLGFEENVISQNLSVFTFNLVSFYLQNAYVKDWVDNSMLFLEVEDIEFFYQKIKDLNLNRTYPTVVLKSIISLDWGKEFFLHDPSGILWHIGSFKK